MSIAPKILARIAIERAVVGKAVDGLLKAGYTVSVDYGEPEYEVEYSNDKAAIMAALFTEDGGLVVDDARLVVHSKELGVTRNKGWVYLVFGNDGYDVVSDHTTNLTEALLDSESFANMVSDGDLGALAECFQQAVPKEVPANTTWPDIAEELLAICQTLVNNAMPRGNGRNEWDVETEDMVALKDKVQEIHDEAVKIAFPKQGGE